MILEVNGQDWSGFVDPYSLKHFYKKVDGPNKGTAMDGSTIFDTIFSKPGFSCRVGLINREDFFAISQVLESDWATVRRVNISASGSSSVVTGRMAVSASSVPEIVLRSGEVYYKNIDLTFTPV